MIERFDGTGRLRERLDPTTRQFTRWNEVGQQVEQRALSVAEAAEVDALATLRTRETRRSTLLDRAAAAKATNLTFIADTNVMAAEMVTQGKALARQNNALIDLVLALYARLDSLDATD